MNLRSMILGLGAIAAAILAPTAPALAQNAAAATAAVVRVDLAAAGGGSQSLSLPMGKSAIIELPVDARDVLVTNPVVADAMLRSSRRIFILGLKSGQTDAVFFDTAGRRILTLDIRVDQDTSAVAQTINRIIPGSKVRVDSMNDSLILSGQVANLADADKAVQVARAAVTKPEQVLNMLSIAGKDQVMLKVRIVEMQRNVIKQLGFTTDLLRNNGSSSFGLERTNTFGVNGTLIGGGDLCYKRDTTRTTNFSNSNNSTTQSGATSSTTGGTNFLETITNGDPELNGNQTITSNNSTSGTSGGVSSLLSTVASTVFSAATGSNLTGCLQAFERVGLVRTLAEPNLTAVSGEAARFLAGGEFPVPVSEEDGKISIDFKPFGVGLGFTPVVLSGGRIALKLNTEVSELSTDGAFSVKGASTTATLVIPALSVRRAETSVELPSGGSMMIAGLLQEKTRQNLDALPGMTTLPVLGALFRSRDYLAGETELVIIVTPYIVQATGADRLQTPVDGMKIADDASTLVMGQLTKAYKAKPQAQAAGAYQGPYGYVIE